VKAKAEKNRPVKANEGKNVVGGWREKRRKRKFQLTYK